MKKYVRYLVILFSFVAQAAGQDPFQSVDQFVGNAMTEYHIPGLALAVVEGNQLVYAKGYGIAGPDSRPVTPQTPFYLASVTKSFTAVAVMQLVEAGRLDLDTPIKHHLPWFFMPDGAAGDHACEKITLRHLLHHTSGIGNQTGQAALPVNNANPNALEQQVRSFAHVPLLHPPGAGYEYANANFQIAGLVVQQISGRSIEQVLQDQIFTPLAMTHSHTDRAAARADGLATGYRLWFGHPVAFTQQPFPRGHFPSGYAMSSAEDLAHYLIAQMNEGCYQNTTLISPQSLLLTHAPGLNNYGMGWFVHTDGVIEHGGHLECFASQLYIDSASRRGVTLLLNVNRGQGCGHFYQLATAIAKLLAGEKVSLPPVDHGNRPAQWQLLAILSVLLGWLAWSFYLLRLWAKQPFRLPHGMKSGIFLLIPPLLEIILISTLIMLVPTAISVAFLFSPDTMALWLLVVILTALWCLTRTLWLYKIIHCGVKNQSIQ